MHCLFFSSFHNQILHVEFHAPTEIQVCSLISIKTGGCPEDCKYCAQSSRYQTSVSAQPMMQYEDVLSEAKKAVRTGATRICLGAAWREVRDSKQFDELLRMIKGITDLGVEVCCTLGMINEIKLTVLKKQGFTLIIIISILRKNFYKTIITTRTYQDRLDTLDIVRKGRLKCLLRRYFRDGGKSN